MASALINSARRVCSVQASASDSAVLSEDDEDVLNDARDMFASRRWNSAEKKAAIFPAVHQYAFARID
ncbi:hypothetical protein [Bradyrhizobium sp. WSM471]|uniref:hypothetical protein n=1 Tax=Bradyrhizobium sp. WSM471 TaxID=319017 RepID=UPI001E58A576|nr:MULTISPECIES: hypothetical protein [Bradyrhizobium]UFW39960.1 hypothetical protein BcanWSM471_27625 [Bradyrhizobium canariense]